MDSTCAWSMTGQGQGHGEAGGCRIDLELRTVNHRHTELRVRADSSLSEHVTWLEGYLRPRIRRGRAEVVVRLEGSGPGSEQLDVERARAVYGQLLALRDELAPEQPLPISVLTSVPGVFSGSSPVPPELARAALQAAADTALQSLDAMRVREGAALVGDLEQRLSLVRSEMAQVEARGPEVVKAARERLRTRLASLLEGTAVTLDEGRIEHETALFADRCDIAEELTRLHSHLGQFSDLLRSSEPVGRKLDFLLQEMGREVNTIGSKANDATTAQHVVSLKAELERIREQTHNLL